VLCSGDVVWGWTGSLTFSGAELPELKSGLVQPSGREEKSLRASVETCLNYLKASFWGTQPILEQLSIRTPVNPKVSVIVVVLSRVVVVVGMVIVIVIVVVVVVYLPVLFRLYRYFV